MNNDTEQTGRTFRLACPERDRALADALLAAEGYAFETEAFSPLARRVTGEPRPLGSSLANFFGLIYIQDKSSMLPPLLLAPEPGARVLDMCASPGGKTSLLALLAGEDGFVLGNEPSRTRLETLRRNLHRMNAASCATCSGPGEDLPLAGGSWPAILLDPPCSGWGTVDKNPSVTTIWRDEKTEPLIRLQRDLLAKAAELLAPGGVILYSTCTTNPRENEEQARFALGELGLELEPLDAPAGFVGEETSVPGTEGVLRVDGRASDAQGFFLARLCKPGTPGPGQVDAGDLPGRALRAAEAQAVADAGADLAALSPGEVLRFKDNVFFVHQGARELLPPDLRWQGYLLGRFTADRFRPHPRVRVLLPQGPGIPFVDVDEVEDVRRLLSGQALEAPAGAAYAVLRFRGHPVARLTVKGRRALWSER
ncbi:NOL1/NOP2/SUN domain family protein [Desulfocurvus sp. DL9XJH121]